MESPEAAEQPRLGEAIIKAIMLPTYAPLSVPLPSPTPPFAAHPPANCRVLLAATLARSTTAAAARRWCWRRRIAGRGPQNFRAPAAGHFSRAFGARQSRHRLSGAHYDVRVGTFLAFLLRACTWSSGSKRDKFFLLHQSIDLDELYPTVPVSQIVTRRKYFFLKMRGHARCTHTADS